MFAQLIEAFCQKNNWVLDESDSNKFFKSQAYNFFVTTFTNDEINDCLWLLKKIDLHPVLKEKDGDKFIVIGNRDYHDLQKAVYCLEEPFNLFSQTVEKDPDLINEYGLYNDIDAETWQYLSRHIRLKTDKTPELITPQDIEKNRQDVISCLNIIKDNMHGVFSNNRVIWELVLLYQFLDKNDENPSELVIDLSQKAQEKLAKMRLGGFAERHDDCIGITTENTVSPHDVMNILIHEIRHIMQKHHLLALSAKSENIVSSCQDYIRSLATEAEANGYTCLNLKDKRPFVTDIFNAHIRHVETAFKEGRIELPETNQKLKHQKLSAINRFIQVEAEKRTIQTLCNVFLAKNRFEAYGVLQTDKTAMPANHFNEMMRMADAWKNQYFNSNINQLITDEKFNQSNDENESDMIEERWKNQTEIRMNLSPKNLFTPEVARTLQIYEAIYGKDTQAAQETKPAYRYTGISIQLVNQLGDCWENNNFDKIIRIYQMIQKKNPFLPLAEEQLNSQELSALTAGRLFKAIICMNEEKSIQEVFQALGYDLTDYFDGRQIRPQRGTQTEKDLNTVSSRIFNDIKQTFTPQNTDNTQCVQHHGSSPKSVSGTYNPLHDLAR